MLYLLVFLCTIKKVIKLTARLNDAIIILIISFSITN
nr:MAG TPA: hypothetical protein [Caudoviricetes sp.]